MPPLRTRPSPRRRRRQPLLPTLLPLRRLCHGKGRGGEAARRKGAPPCRRRCGSEGGSSGAGPSDQGRGGRGGGRESRGGAKEHAAGAAGLSCCPGAAPRHPSPPVGGWWELGSVLFCGGRNGSMHECDVLMCTSPPPFLVLVVHRRGSAHAQGPNRQVMSWLMVLCLL